MKPDPYKIARARRYLAKQKAKSGESSKEKLDKIPRWLKNLPSNASRYQADEEEPFSVNSGSTTALPDDFDVDNAADIQELLEEFDLKVVNPSKQVLEILQEDNLSDFYKKNFMIDVAFLDNVLQSSLSNYNDPDLPEWLNVVIDDDECKSKCVPSSKAPIQRISDLVRSRNEKYPSSTPFEVNRKDSFAEDTRPQGRTKDEEFLDDLLESSHNFKL